MPEKQLNVALPDDLRRAFKAKVALENTTMQAKILAWVERYIEGSK